MISTTACQKPRHGVIVLISVVFFALGQLSLSDSMFAAPPEYIDDQIVPPAQNSEDSDEDSVSAEVAVLMQPQTRAPAAGTPPARRSASPLALGAATSRLGGPQGPQAGAPPVIGDRFGGGQSCIIIPVMVGRGTPFTTTVQAGSTSVPFQGFGSGQPGPLRITSPNEPPAFPSRNFITVGDGQAANNTFKAGQNIPLQNQPQFNGDAQNFLVGANPAGTVLPTGQTSAGGGTAQPQGTEAVLDTAASGPQNGRDLQSDDLFFIRGNFLFVPDVFFGPQQPTMVCVDPASSGAGVLGTPKLAENCSPLPRDRFYFNYSYFDDTPLTPTGQPVNRFSPGFEKTFFDEMASVEMRFPFAATINPDLRLTESGITPDDDVIFGNISVIFKGLLYQTDKYAFSAGLQVATPTAPDLLVSTVDGTRIVEIENQAVHLMPFIGLLHTPNDRFFAQAFLQFDADANGNPVAINPTMQQLKDIGRLHDSTFMYVDLNVGYWMYRSTETRVTGIAPTVELHYNTSLESSEFLASDGFVIGSNLQQISNLNLTVGSYVELGLDNSFVLGYTMPVGNGVDHQFDGELRAFYTHRFGANTRASRVGF